MPKCILHIGMHKTGTTSIQLSLAELADENFYYARILGSPGHSLAICSIFASKQRAQELVESRSKGDGTPEQKIAAARRAITRHMKRQGRVWIRIFPDVPVSAKPVEVRMGKGKGSVDFWAAKVKPGRIMFEIDGVAEDIAREALRLGAMKLPVTTRIVAKEDW